MKDVWAAIMLIAGDYSREALRRSRGRACRSGAGCRCRNSSPRTTGAVFGFAKCGRGADVSCWRPPIHLFPGVDWRGRRLVSDRSSE